jgi:hypothetical protein
MLHRVASRIYDSHIVLSGNDSQSYQTSLDQPIIARRTAECGCNRCSHQGFRRSPISRECNCRFVLGRMIIWIEAEFSSLKEICSHIFQTLFNLCRLSRPRQEEAAINGIIPILQRVLEKKSPLKEFALPILCDMVNAGKTARRQLWKYGGVQGM